MSNNKQSSVEYFKEQIVDIVEDYKDDIITLNEYIIHINSAFEQAKQMHKEEIIKAQQIAFYDSARLGTSNYTSPYEEWDDYYNETFGGEQ